MFIAVQACEGNVTNGITAKLVVSVTPLKEAEIVAAFGHSRRLVLTVNVALVVPSGMVTDAGTLTDESLLDNETIAPPVGAGPLSETVPVESLPLITPAGFSTTEDNATLRLKKTLAGPVGVDDIFQTTYTFPVGSIAMIGLLPSDIFCRAEKLLPSED